MIPVFIVTVSDFGPAPTSFTAMTLKKYVVAVVRPVILYVITLPAKQFDTKDLERSVAMEVTGNFYCAVIIFDKLESLLSSKNFKDFLISKLFLQTLISDLMYCMNAPMNSVGIYMKHDNFF